MNAREAIPMAFVGFSLVASLTWFFSYRPRVSDEEINWCVTGPGRARRCP